MPSTFWTDCWKGTAGRASIKIRRVDVTVMTRECSRYGTAFEIASRYCSRVGLNKKCGGSVAASASVLNPVSAIHRTGKKKARTISQVRSESALPPMLVCFLRLFCGGSAVAPAPEKTVSAVIGRPSLRR